MNKSIYRLDSRFKWELHSSDSNSLIFIRQEIDLLDHLYPNIKQWYKNTFSVGFFKKQRKLLLIKDMEGELAAFSLLKDTEFEKKICTLYVCPTFRESGIGNKLVPLSVNLLGEKNIGITVSQDVNPLLESLLKTNSFEVNQVENGLYLPNKKEFFYKLY
ncbi:N-acetyltransferase [Acinetobacter haemolyticus]|uniref:N-acetyltransferase n=1 Tax=Acinetobacter haemolyticus TaxID=29430 RepID=UPI002DBE95F5|nr:N-acetyltransferase [Acinetobacter haemolyticus]MEB6675576.1 N-acetyltransferase [Acinetobacter haemolyticus]